MYVGRSADPELLGDVRRRPARFHTRDQQLSTEHGQARPSMSHESLPLGLVLNTPTVRRDSHLSTTCVGTTASLGVDNEITVERLSRDAAIESAAIAVGYRSRMTGWALLTTTASP